MRIFLNEGKVGINELDKKDPISVVLNSIIYAEVVTRVAGSLEAGGFPRYPKSLFVEINVAKP